MGEAPEASALEEETEALEDDDCIAPPAALVTFTLWNPVGAASAFALACAESGDGLANEVAECTLELESEDPWECPGK